MPAPSPHLHTWPAEWEPHAATWIAWPHNIDTWPGDFDPIEPLFIRLISILADVEPVHVLGGPAAAYERAMFAVGSIPNVVVHAVETNDCWIRDYGPTFVRQRDNGEVIAVDWRYNAWGGKWPPWDLDAAAAEKIAQLAGVRRVESTMTCEGGGLESDGAGTLLATPQSILVDTRNSGWSQADAEAELQRQLGVDKILWVPHGSLAGDDTDSHIDQLARFTAAGRVLAAVSYTPDDENFTPLRKQLDALRTMQDASGKTLEVVPLTTPPPRYVRGERVPESYCNFYLANGIVVVPTFGFADTDEAACRIISEQFLDRTLVPLDASEMVRGLGAFHCATQQQPAAL